MIRVFCHRNKWTPTDPLSFVGWPPLFRPAEQPVHISVTFTWDMELGQRLRDAWGVYYSDVQIGGPAFDDPGGQFEPGRYIKDGVTITSRGCNKRCPWCFVPRREGLVRELKIKPGNIIQDNNLLACSEGHIRQVFAMLQGQNAAVFSGGIDTTLLKDWPRPLFELITVKEIWVACDTWTALKALQRAALILDGFNQSKLRCYAMIGFNGESLAQAERRLETIYEAGFLPFCQLYQGGDRKVYSPEWRALARKWARPAAYRSANNQFHKDTLKTGCL